MIDLRPPSRFSRRHFLWQLLGLGVAGATGADSLLAQDKPVLGAESCQFAFLTDLHLLKEGDLRSAEGIAACLAAVERLEQRPEFLVAGGDLVNAARDLTIAEAEKRFDLFLRIWNDHTSLPTHWVFGNHDLVGTSNPTVSSTDPLYSKGLFMDRLRLPRLFYSFDFKGWHFVILDDIALQEDHHYFGKLFDEELAFLQADLASHQATPTVVCCHIPLLSNLPLGLLLAQEKPTPPVPPGRNLVCSNGTAALQNFAGHNVRAVLSGHLHFLEKIDLNGIRFVNSGAVCGNYWKGPMRGCVEGFGVVDLGADGSVAFDYRDFGWKA